MKNNKPKLAFDQLLQEMEVITREQQLEFLGGDVSSGGEYEYTTGNGGNGSVTGWLSQVFGTPVSSSVDMYGNWMITIGNTTIPLTFQLDEVSITANGSVSSSGQHFFNTWEEWVGTSYYYNTGNYGNWGGYNGGGSGTTTPSLPAPNAALNGYLDDLFGFTSTNLVGQYTSVFESNWGDHAGIDVYTGTISGNNGLFITFNTTTENGTASSIDLSMGSWSVSVLAEGGFRVSSTLGGTTTSVGLSTERGVLLGQSISNGRAVAGFEINNWPGGGEVLAALALIGAIVTDGAIIPAYGPELAPLFGI